MEPVNFDYVERYQDIIEKDPDSRAFAPLAEAYRKMGLTQEALRLCEHGVRRHPHFAGGHVAYARLLMDQMQLDMAAQELEEAIQLAPENWLAHALLAETYVKLKQPKKALSAYKMLLLLDPQNEKALKAVKKLESLTADEYDADLFALKKLPQALDVEAGPAADGAGSGATFTATLDRYISLSDAYLVRHEWDRALETLNEAEERLGHHPEITKRLNLLRQRWRGEADERPPSSPPEHEAPRAHEAQIQLLEDLLRRVKAHKTTP